MNGIKSKLSYANVVATIAMFAALGGGAYAAKVAKNSVGGSQIKKNAVTASEVKAGAIGASETGTDAVGSAEVIDGSLTGSDLNGSTLFNDNSLNGADINESSLSGLPRTAGGTLAQNGTETIQLAEGSLTYTCSDPSIYSNDSGTPAEFLTWSGGHNDVAGGVENIFAGEVTTANGADSTFGFPNPGELEGAIITDDNVAFFEIWQVVDGSFDCVYAISVTEVVR